MNKKILLIGGNGYIGSKICSDLSDIYNIEIIDKNLFNHNIKKNITHICDYNSLDKQFISKFTDIILLAGHSSVRMCETDPVSVFNNNIRNFINLVSKLNDTQTLIYASSASVYGNSKLEVITEESVLSRPHNLYDMSKQMIDNYILTSFSKKRIFGLRFGTVNGFSPTLRNDVMLNAMTYSAWENKKVTLYNQDTKRSILGINDLIEIIKILLNSNKKEGEIYNISSFTSTSGELAHRVSDILKCPIENKDIAFPTLNEKLISNKYNFSLSCEKFIKDFSFKFSETPDTIIRSLVDNKNNIIFSDRNAPYVYEE